MKENSPKFFLLGENVCVGMIVIVQQMFHIGDGRQMSFPPMTLTYFASRVSEDYIARKGASL